MVPNASWGKNVPWRWQKRLSEVLVYNGYKWPSQKKIRCPCKETTQFRFDHILVTKSSKHSWEVHFILIQQVPFSRGEIGSASVICGVVCRLTVGGPEIPFRLWKQEMPSTPPENQQRAPQNWWVLKMESLAFLKWSLSRVDIPSFSRAICHLPSAKKSDLTWTDESYRSSWPLNEATTLPPTIIEVKNGSISNGSYLSSTAIFQFHDYGRKSKESILYCWWSGNAVAIQLGGL